jgi:hypothetical protein
MCWVTWFPKMDKPSRAAAGHTAMMQRLALDPNGMAPVAGS